MKQIPFYSNTSDNTHCLQACYRMILKYFLPDRDYSWEELDRLTGKKEGKWTWPMKGLMNMKALGFEVKHITYFDYEVFSKIGIEYLKKEWGEDIAKVQDYHSDMQSEMSISKIYQSSGIHMFRQATVQDIKNLLDEKYLLICDVNQKVFLHTAGYNNHFVVVYGMNKEEIQFHDPGLPSFESQKLSVTEFQKAWEYPTHRDATLQALRLNNL